MEITESTPTNGIHFYAQNIYNILKKKYTYISMLALCSIPIITFVIHRKLKRKEIHKTDENTNTSVTYNTQCPICFNEILIGVRASCGHAYCLDCLENFSSMHSFDSSNYICPYCRSYIQEVEFVNNGTYTLLSKAKQKEMQLKLDKIKGLQSTWIQEKCLVLLRCFLYVFVIFFWILGVYSVI